MAELEQLSGEIENNIERDMNEVEPNLAEFSERIDKARAAYQVCLQQRNWDGVETSLMAAKTWLDNTYRDLEKAQKPAPSWMRDLELQVVDLEKRFNVVREALAHPQAREALVRVRVQSRMLGADAVLDALEKQLQEQVQKELPLLLKQAELEVRSGNVRKAQETLRLASEIDPGNFEIWEKLFEVEEHANLLDAIQQARRTYTSQHDSPTQAVKALKSGLDAIRNANERLVGTELREALDTLFRLALGKHEHYAEAQHLIAEIGKARNTSWVAREASQLVDEWLSLARMIALEGFISSATQMGQYLDAYRAASSMMQKNPHDEKLVRQEAHIREAMINRQAASAMKRLHWARTALERDDFAEALASLESIEKEFFGPVEREFPNLLDGIDTIDAIRAQARELLPRIEQAQQLHQKAQPILDEALVLFQQNRLEEAEAKLGELTGVNLSETPRLQQRTRELREMVEQARQKNAQRQVQEGLAGVQAGLKLARTAADFQKLQGDLDALKQQVNLNTQPAELQNEYTKLLALVDDEANKLVESGIYKTRGQAALEREDYAGAVISFTKALDSTRIPEERIELEGLLSQASAQNEKQRGFQAALEAGYSSLEQGDYDRARLAFSKVLGLGVGAESALKICSIGNLYQEARQKYERGEWEGAKDALIKSQERLSDMLVSDDIEQTDEFARRQQAVVAELREQIEALLWETNRLISKGDERRKKLAEARQAYLGNNFPLAEQLAQEILDKAPENLEALAIQGVCAAHKLYLEGHDDEARSVLKQLPEKVSANPLVITLLGQINARYEVNRLLNQAVNQARNGQFKAARESLLQAARQNPDKAHYEEAQGKVEELLQGWERRTIHPIRDALRQGEKDGNYAEAVRLCENALAQSTAGEFQAELNRLLVAAIDQWAQHDYQAISRQLSEFGTEAELSNLKNRLALTLVRKSELLPEKIASQLELLGQDIEKRIQLARLEQAEQIYKELVQRFLQAESRSELLALKNEINVIVDGNPIFAQNFGEKAQALQQDIDKKVIQSRLIEARQLNEQKEWDKAILRLAVIRQDAENWGDVHAVDEIDLLLQQIRQSKSDEILSAIKTFINRRDWEGALAFLKEIEKSSSQFVTEQIISVVKLLIPEVVIMLGVQQDVERYKVTEEYEAPSLQEQVEKLTGLRYPWIVDTTGEIVIEIEELRAKKIAFYLQRGNEFVNQAQDAVFWKVMADLYEKATVSFKEVLAWDPDNNESLALVESCGSQKAKIDKISQGNKEILIAFLEQKGYKKELIGKIRERMYQVTYEFKDTKEYTELKDKLDGLLALDGTLDPGSNEFIKVPEDHVEYVLADIDASLKRSKDKKAWYISLILTIIWLFLSGYLLYRFYGVQPLPDEFPTALVLCSAWLGSSLYVLKDLSSRAEKRARILPDDAVRLALVRPLTGMGVTFLIILTIFAIAGKFLNLSFSLSGYWEYISLSFLLGYSDFLMNKIVELLEKGVSVKFGS